MHLNPALSFCEVQGQLVFIDSQQDRYFCLGEGLEHALRAAIANEARPSDVEMLASRGIVTSGPSAAIMPCGPEIAAKSLLEEPARAPSSPLRMLALAYEIARTRRRLRRAGLARSLGALERAKTSPRREVSLEGPALAAIAMDFERLGLLTTAHNQCLPRSLALATYLARRGFLPELILGVRLGPFGAHCWVECDGLLVNDRFERVRPFTPIRRL